LLRERAGGERLATGTLRALDVDVDSVTAWAREALLNRRAVLERAGDGATEGGRLELDEIEAALGRIEGGRFGLCEVCGGSVGRGRLRAMPEARRCTRCE
jgi:RNA polymerase-binding transcription factor DksA